MGAASCRARRVYVGTGALVLAAAALVGCARDEVDVHVARPSVRRGLFLMFSANAPREAPGVFRAYLRRDDYVRLESLPARWRALVRRSHRYVLPTTLRHRWAGEPGLRHWSGRGCGRGTAGMIVYDPEHWELTPPREQDAMLSSIRRAARIVEATGCHSFGLAPEAGFMFGLTPRRCRYALARGRFRQVPWELVHVVDIQVQRLVADHCWRRLGVDDYVMVVRALASFVRGRSPETAVVAQVSLRHTPPSRMRAALGAVADEVDGVYISYPSSNTDNPCRYCSPSNLRAVLAFLRGDE